MLPHQPAEDERADVDQVAGRIVRLVELRAGVAENTEGPAMPALLCFCP
jgi:hypothetical protein